MACLSRMELFVANLNVCVCVWTWRGDRETLKRIVKMQTSIISRWIPAKLGIPFHGLYVTCGVQFWGMTLVGQCDDISILWFHCWHLFSCMWKTRVVIPVHAPLKGMPGFSGCYCGASLQIAFVISLQTFVFSLCNRKSSILKTSKIFLSKLHLRWC